ncbi:MAG TPA: hypothetical protein VFO10_11700 [Oligoflexus sp.]|uniref:monooxygenase n=1 Tax=Oligoflexus sp. TaxID=1971216 RepID=UPI002D7EDB7D|nr:hypothetical protein [Oligoflexus sp.]HET9237911.1 hypothetical protein [Oligoflexus sp.]
MGTSLALLRPKHILAAVPLLLATPILASGQERLPGFNVPAPQPGAMEIVTPILGEIKPGEEVMYCTYLDGDLPNDIYVASYRAFQSREGAHHAILYSVKNRREPGTYVCGSAEESMAEETTFLAATGGATENDPGTSVSLPEGVLFRAVKGRQFMIQTHWVNYFDKPIQGQAAFQIMQREKQPTDKLADNYFLSTAQFRLDPNDSNRTVQARCTMREDATFFLTSGHMHEYGKHIKVTLNRSTGESMKILEHSWNKHFTAVPPSIKQEIELKKGDEFIVDCTYKDKLDKVLTFPAEMCGVTGFYYPAQKSMICFDNVMQ